MAKHITIRDVANQAGVSIATASRALNDPSYPVNSQLRQRVKEAAERLEYVPNQMARSLRENTSRDIALVIPNISNPFYLQTMLGINNVLLKQNYNLILCNTMRDVEQERQYLRQLFERRISGVILSSVEKNADMVHEYTRKGMKFVLLDQLVSGSGCPGIDFDSCAGARMAMEYLISMGHKCIAFGTLPMTRWTRIEMRRGYEEALRTANIEYDPALIYECSPNDVDPDGDLELQVGHRIGQLLACAQPRPDAIMCVNDMVAIGVIQTLLKAGIRIPEDISVMGFDDIPFAGAFLPALTTVHYPAMETGRLAALMMMDILSSGGKEMSLSVSLTPKLVIRDTVSDLRERPDAEK